MADETIFIDGGREEGSPTSERKAQSRCCLAGLLFGNSMLGGQGLQGGQAHASCLRGHAASLGLHVSHKVDVLRNFLPRLSL